MAEPQRAQQEKPAQEPAEVVKLPRDVRLARERYKLLEQESRQHVVTIEDGHAREDLLRPSYWAGIASQFKQYDEIVVRRDDDAIYAKLLVVDANRTAARMFVLEWHDLTKTEDHIAAAVDALNEFELAKMGPHLLWCVIRKKDRVRVSEKHQTREAAGAWLRNHITSQR